MESGQNRVCHPRTRISKALSHCRPRQAPDSSTVSRSEVSVVPSATSYLRGNLRLFRRRSRIKQRCMQWASRGSDSPGQWLHACAPGAIGVRGLHACRCCHPGSLAPHLCQASQPLLCHCSASSAFQLPPSAAGLRYCEHFKHLKGGGTLSPSSLHKEVYCTYSLTIRTQFDGHKRDSLWQDTLVGNSNQLMASQSRR